MKLRNAIFYSVLPALGYLWAGSAFISHMYCLYAKLPFETANQIALRWNYLAQAIGIIFFIFAMIKIPDKAAKKISYFVSLGLSAVFMVLMLLCKSTGLIIAGGLFFNFFIGSLSAWHLMLIAAHVPQQMMARAYGFSFAVGSFGTYLISLFYNGLFLSPPVAPVLYLILIGINGLLIIKCDKNLLPYKDSKSSSKAFPKETLTILMIVIFVMSLLYTIGGRYDVSNIVDAKVNLEFARAFYALGLILAGILFDISRKHGAITCFASLVFPFFVILLYDYDSLIIVAWVLGYILLGLFSVYRAVLFMDVAIKDTAFLSLAALGLFVTRLGEVTITYVPSQAFDNNLSAYLIIGSLFVILVFLFFFAFQKLYMPIYKPTPDYELQLLEFEKRYGLTIREMDVLIEIAGGYSNAEISAKLFVSENTVKFHMKNLLKKTSCSNRSEVVQNLKSIK